MTSTSVNEAEYRALPDFLIIGVQKSATTALFDTLTKLEGFAPSLKKEIHFFDIDSNYQKGFEWYARHFSGEIGSIAFEATPSYIYSGDAVRRIAGVMRGKKFVLMLRDPVIRCWSAWNMFKSFNAHPDTAKHIYEEFIEPMNPLSRTGLRDLLFCKNYPSFEQCVDEDLMRWTTQDSIEEPSFVRRGFYYQQIAFFLQYFSLDDLLILDHQEFNDNPNEIIERICSFLGVGVLNCGSVPVSRSNIGDYGTAISKESKLTLLRLYDVYRDSNEKLFKLLGRNFSWGPSWLD